jgi:hypothetical protein
MGVKCNGIKSLGSDWIRDRAPDVETSGRHAGKQIHTSYA